MRRFSSGKKRLAIVSAIVLFSIATILAASGKYNFPIVKAVLFTVLKPIEAGFTDISNAISKTGRLIGSVMYVSEENEALKKEVAALKKINVDTQEVWAENQRLREMLNYVQSQTRLVLLPARVVGYNSGSIESSIIIDRGSNDGIKRDMAVITPHGLVGSVNEVYKNAARIQIILHPRAAVGGMVQRTSSRTAGIVSGNASTPFTPNLLNLARDADVKEGDMIITSGYGGIYPKGIVIGEVISVNNAEGGLLKYAVIQTAVDFQHLEEVMVITNVNNFSEAILQEEKAGNKS